MPASRGFFRIVYDRYLRYILAVEQGALPERTMLVTTLVNVSLLAALLVPVFLLEYAVVRMWSLVLPLSVAGALMVGSPIIYRLTGSLSLARESFIFALLPIVMRPVTKPSGRLPYRSRMKFARKIASAAMAGKSFYCSL